MTAKSKKETPTIGIRSNWLTVGKRKLRADVLPDAGSEKRTVSAEELENILILGRRTVLQEIETFYGQQVQKYPGNSIVRPSVWTAKLGSTAQTDGRDSQVFTELGYDNGSVITSPREIQPQFHLHWQAVREAGFLPEVRSTSGKIDGGSWLLLRKPSLDDVLHHWFNYPSGYTERATEWLKHDDEESEALSLRKYHMIGERKVERGPEVERPRAQVGLMIAMAAIKLTLGDGQAYERDIDTVFDYADNHPGHGKNQPGIDKSTIRAIENATFELDE